MAFFIKLILDNPKSLLIVALLTAAIVLVVYLIINEIIRYNARLQGIPGPPGLPIIGNLHQIHNKISAEQYRRWSTKYGEVFQVQLGNMPILVVNSAVAAKAIFLAQGSAMSSRPIFHVFHKVVSKSIASIGTSPWNESCKNRRKAAAGALNKAKSNSYLPILRLESKELIRELLDSVEDGDGKVDYHTIIQRYSLNLVLTLNYGTRVASAKELKTSKALSEIIYVESEISKLRSTAVNYSNYIPFLRIFEPFQRTNVHAVDIGRRRIQYNAVLLEELKERIKARTDEPCIQGNVLKDPDVKLSQDELTSISLSMMAGAESSTPTIEWALLLLSRTPSIQETAYQAIQGAVGYDFDPFFDQEIDYIMAFTKEVLRYYTVLRLALPKAAYTDAEWNGHKIPKGTTVFLNAWACNRDEKVFQDPFLFRPERWLRSAEDHPGISHYSFGYGARMCVAAQLTNRALYIVFLQIIANFRILPADAKDDVFGRDEEVNEIHPVNGVETAAGLTAEPSIRSVKFVVRDLGKLRRGLEKI